MMEMKHLTCYLTFISAAFLFRQHSAINHTAFLQIFLPDLTDFPGKPPPTFFLSVRTCVPSGLYRPTSSFCCRSDVSTEQQKKQSGHELVRLT